jgi:nucleoside-diphosphate-sugar epimerase
MAKVLVTGGSGFVGAHLIVQLLDAGHQVRTTVRNLNREKAVEENLAKPISLRECGWSPRSSEDAVVATAESLMRFGLVKPR